MAKFVFDRERQEIVPKPEPEEKLQPLPFESPSLTLLSLTDLEHELRHKLYDQYLGL